MIGAHRGPVAIARAPVLMRQQLAEVAAVDPGSAGRTMDEVVGFACDWRAPRN